MPNDGPPGDFEIELGNGGGDSDDSSSAPAVDPIQARREAMLQQIYMELWGEPAPESYIKANSNMNSYEFALNERAKPAWIQTKAFKDSYNGVAGMLSRLGV